MSRLVREYHVRRRPSADVTEWMLENVDKLKRLGIDPTFIDTKRGKTHLVGLLLKSENMGGEWIIRSAML